MSLQTKCSECGEWFAIGRNRAVGEPCHRCQQKKAQFAAEIAATYPKPKCPVFGCTIPRGIPHEHPAGVSAVMRDPGSPLTDIERAELQYHRQQEAVRNQMELNQMGIGQVPGQSPYAWAPNQVPMNPGPKLRDALIMAGIADADAGRTKPLSEVKARYSAGASSTGDLITADEISRRVSELAGSFDQSEPRRLSVAQIAGRIATGIVLAIGVASILILSAMTAGWL